MTLDGYVPDEATRAALLAAARAAVPGGTVEDKQALGVGAPADFRSAAAFAITQLGRLDKAEARLTGTALAVSGRASLGRPATPQWPASREFPRATPSRGRTSRRRASRPYLWSATRAGGRITLAGHVPDEATKAALATTAAAPGVTVEDRQDLGLGAPEGFGEMAATALRHLLRLENGEASLANSALSLTGRADSIGLRDEIVAALQRLPAGYALGRLDLTAPEPPPPPPRPPASTTRSPPSFRRRRAAAPAGARPGRSSGAVVSVPPPPRRRSRS